MNVELDKLSALLTAREGPEQGLALVETLREQVPWEELLARVTVHGHPFDKYPVTAEDREPFQEAYKLTLGRFEPIIDGVYRRAQIAERTNLVLRLLALAPRELEVRGAKVVWVDGNDGVIDASALVRALPQLESLMLVSCELDDWDELSRLALKELRLYRCRRFEAIASYRAERVWIGETTISDGRAFGAVTELYLRGRVHAKALRAFRSLRFIRCIGWSACTNELLEAMATLPALEIIDVDQTVKALVRGTGKYAQADLSVFARTPELRVLKLRKTHIDPHKLDALVGHPTLETIQLDTKWRRRVPKKVRSELPFV